MFYTPCVVDWDSFVKVPRPNWNRSGYEFMPYSMNRKCNFLPLAAQENMLTIFGFSFFKNLKELSGTLITAKKGQTGKKGVFKEDGSLDALFQGNVRYLRCS